MYVEIDSGIIQLDTNYIINYLVISKQAIFKLVEKTAKPLCENAHSVLSDIKEFIDANNINVDDCDNEYYYAMLAKVYETNRKSDRSDYEESPIDHFRLDLVKIILLLDGVLYLLQHGKHEGVLKLMNLNGLLVAANETSNHKTYKHYESPEIAASNITGTNLVSGNGKKALSKTCANTSINSDRNVSVASDNLLYVKPVVAVKQLESENAQVFDDSLVSRSPNTIINNCKSNNALNKLKEEKIRLRKITVDENCKQGLRDDYDLQLYYY
jgi:hypothetical protein